MLSSIVSFIAPLRAEPIFVLPVFSSAMNFPATDRLVNALKGTTDLKHTYRFTKLFQSDQTNMSNTGTNE